MRPTSVIFLIISILLACFGGILCLRAYSIAEENGEVLFASVKNEDGQFVTTRYFGLSEDETPDTSNKKNDTKKLELSLSNVDVIIKGGQTKVVNIKDQTAVTKLVDMLPDVIDKVRGKKSSMISDEEAVKAAFPEPEIEDLPVVEKEAANE